jgi:uncharacterized membrane protein
MSEQKLNNQTVFQLKFQELVIVILSLVFGGFVIAAKVFEEIDNGYIYGAISLLAGGILLIKSRIKTSIK